MTRSDVLHFKGVVEGREDFLDVRIARYHEVKPTCNEVYARVDGGRSPPTRTFSPYGKTPDLTSPS